MIHLMPFTYLSKSLLDRLNSLFGPLSIGLPLADLMSNDMREAVERGSLHPRTPEAIDSNRLRRSFHDFLTWADAHRGRSGDLVGFFRGSQMRAGGPVDEAGVHQIRDQLRRRAEGLTNQSVDPLMEAALFLCLAHTFDQQQESLAGELDKVHAMEENLERILGEPDPETPAMGATSPSLQENGMQDRGAYMTRMRLESWARIAASGENRDCAFLTTSRAVMEDLQELWPGLRRVAEGAIAVDSGEPSASPALLQSAFDALSRAEHPDTAVADLFAHILPNRPGVPFSLYIVQGCSPERFIARMVSKKAVNPDASPQTPPPSNAVIGHIRI